MRIDWIPYCGSCMFFRNEGADGTGVCGLSGRLMSCGEQCDIDYTELSPRVTAKALSYYQKWRRGKGLTAPSPYVTGKVIDAALWMLRKTE